MFFLFQSGPPLPSLLLSNMSCQIKKDDIWALSSPLLHLYRPRWSGMWWFSPLTLYTHEREGSKRLSGPIVDSNGLHAELLGKLPYLQKQFLQSFKFLLKFCNRQGSAQFLPYSPGPILAEMNPNICVLRTVTTIPSFGGGEGHKGMSWWSPTKIRDNTYASPVGEKRENKKLS